MYGISNHDAVLETCFVNIIVIAIAIHNSVITIKPNRGFCNPKNTADHNKFRVSCKQKTANACLRFFDSRFTHVRYSEIDIKKYNTVQTGPKTQLGGLKLGFTKSAYHVGIAGVVMRLPNAAILKQRTKDANSFE